MLPKKNVGRYLWSKSNKKDSPLPSNFIICFFVGIQRSSHLAFLPLLSISCGIQLSSHGSARNGICVTGLKGCLSIEQRGGDRTIWLPSQVIWNEVRNGNCDGSGQGTTVVGKRTPVYSSNFESVISNLILWRISLINSECVHVHSDRGYVRGVGLPNWLIAKVYIYTRIDVVRCGLALIGHTQRP